MFTEIAVGLAEYILLTILSSFLHAVKIIFLFAHHFPPILLQQYIISIIIAISFSTGRVKMPTAIAIDITNNVIVPDININFATIIPATCALLFLRLIVITFLTVLSFRDIPVFFQILSHPLLPLKAVHTLHAFA